LTLLKTLLDAIFRRDHQEAEMADELRFHIETRAEHLQRLGTSADEAMRLARLEFGGVEGYKERCREERGFHVFDEIRSDVRFTFRALWKIPGFTSIAVLSLALSIGVNLTCFASMYSMVLRPFAYRDLERIMTIFDVRANSNDRSLVANANYLDWKQRNHSFEYLAAYREWDANVSRVQHPDHVEAAAATAELFQVLGVKPALGRAFTMADCQPGRDTVAVVGHGFWQTRLASAPEAIGKTMGLNGRTYTIIGVMPEEFNLPLSSEIWVPLGFTREESTDRQRGQLSVIGKLRNGVMKREAAADLNNIAQQLQLEYPRTNESHRVLVINLTETITSESGHFIAVLMCAALFVLLLGSVNVGSLQVARAMSREKEIGLRSALGATSWRIHRQLLIENLAIALAGGIVGLILATWHLNVIRANIPAAVYQLVAGLRDMRMNAQVALYGLMLSIVAGLLCCIPATLQVVRSGRSGDLNQVLKEGGRTSRSSGRRRLRSMLVAGEVAMAFVLGVGAGLMVSTLRKIATLDLGYTPANLLTAKLSLSGSEYQKPSSVVAFYDGVLRDLNRGRDMDASAVISNSGPVESVFIEGREQARPGELRPDLHAASFQFLRAMRMPLLKGRWLSDDDGESAAKVVVLSASVVRHYWPNSDPLGQRIRFGSADAPWLTVVGVTGDINDWFLGRPQPAAYVSYRQYPQTAVKFLLRGRNDSRRLAGTLRAAMQEMDKEQLVYQVHTVEEEMHEETTGVRNAADMMGTYAVIALLLAVTGIYSVTSFFVAQRNSDLAIRMSLGATRESILRMVLGQSCRLAGWGLAVGVPAAIFLTLGMSRALYGIVPVEPGIFLLFIAILSGSAALAGYVPAYRAARVDPVTILRQE
jgi:putative ABC transport system permease protein